MDNFSHSKTRSGVGSGVGFLVAAVIVVLVLLYALFAGGGDTTADQSAPALEDITPVEPAVPAVGE